MGAHSGPDIVNDGLRFVADVNNIKSYSGSGNSWENVIDNYQSTGSSIPSVFNAPDWLSSAITEISVIAIVEVIGSNTGYAYNPVAKWNSTSDATFVLYHFQQWTDNVRTNLFGWYANRGSTWGTVSSQYFSDPGNTYVFALQYNSTDGGLMWINGEKYGSRTASGVLATSTQNIRIDGGPDKRSGIHHTKNVLIYDRELTDDEMVQNYQSLRSTYGI